MTNIRRHLTFANAIAAIALFVALGGGAVAAIQSPGRSAACHA